MKTTAIQSFHQPPERFNCAQAVIHAYRSVSGHEVHHPEAFKPYGGGRAPEGTCGALFAASQIVGTERAKPLAHCFEKRLGARTCKELKSLSVPCTACVETAAELLETSLIAEPSK